MKVVVRGQEALVCANLIHPLQMGGIQQRSTVDASACLIHKIVQARDAGLFTTALAVDIAQFFPSIQHNMLTRILANQGFPPFVVQCIQNWLQKRMTTYAMGAAHSDPCPLDTGVPQGDPLSPLLSALYIAPTIWTLFPADLHKATACIFYVDDGVILHSSMSLRYNCAVLQKLFKRLNDSFAALGLSLEPAKTELMHFLAYDLTKKGHPFQDPSLPDID